MGFCSLQHLSGSPVHLTRALPARFVPPSGFGHPLGGFRPSNPCRFCFAPTALLGFTLRSFLLPIGIPCVSTRNRPTYRFSRRCSPPPKRRTGTTSRSFWVLTFRESLAATHGFSMATTGCSLGFHPSRALPRKLRSGFRPISSPVLHGLIIAYHDHRHPRVSINFRLLISACYVL
jgi:hypothetical protein